MRASERNPFQVNADHVVLHGRARDGQRGAVRDAAGGVDDAHRDGGRPADGHEVVAHVDQLAGGGVHLGVRREILGPVLHGAPRAVEAAHAHRAQLAAQLQLIRRTCGRTSSEA